MRIALLVAGHRFTGAAAVAEHWCRALRQADVQAELVFRSGGNLQWRLIGCPWAKPVLIKERGPRDLAHNLRILRKISTEYDACLSFLPHDHVLALSAGLRRNIPLIRAYRHPGHLGADPFHSTLAKHCDAALLPFQSLEVEFRYHSTRIPVESIPVAIEDRFRPIPRQRPSRTVLPPIMGMVGKMAPGRGFEEAIDILSLLNQPCHLLLVGHGEAEEALRQRAAERGVAEKLIFTGKQEARLPELFNSMSLLLFIVPGSDWGHRVISEAQACGLPVIAAPIPGVEDLITDGLNGFIVDGGAPAMAVTCQEILENHKLRLQAGRAALQSAAERSFESIGTRLRLFFEPLLGR